MDEKRQTEPMPQGIDQFEDEIELMDYLKVLWKYLILVGTLVCAVGAAVISLQMTKVYGINTALQPGILKVTDDGKTVYIDSPQNIKALIETGAFNGQILKNIQVSDSNDLPESVEFEVKIPKGTSVLDVLYETPNIDLGLQIVKNLHEAMLEKYERLVEYYKENWKMQIAQRMSEVEDKERF